MRKWILGVVLSILCVGVYWWMRWSDRREFEMAFNLPYPATSAQEDLAIRKMIVHTNDVAEKYGALATQCRTADQNITDPLPSLEKANVAIEKWKEAGRACVEAQSKKSQLVSACTSLYGDYKFGLGQTSFVGKKSVPMLEVCYDLYAELSYND